MNFEPNSVWSSVPITPVNDKKTYLVNHDLRTMSFLEPTPLPGPLFSLSYSTPVPCDHHFTNSVLHLPIMIDASSFIGGRLCNSTPPKNNNADPRGFDDDIFDDFPCTNIEHVEFDLDRIKIEPLRCTSDYDDESTHADSKEEGCDSMTKRSHGESPSSNRRWNERYEEMVAYKKRFGNCCVPSQWVENPRLAQWVKRQRYQLKLRKEGMHSTMSLDREASLNKLGFTWDPHTAFWEERLGELERFREAHGHCNVPTKYPDNPQLAIWAKCQRRQMKLYLSEGPSKSNMTPDRIEKLNELGFVFNPRGLKREPRSSSLPDLRRMLLKSKDNNNKNKLKAAAAQRHSITAVFPSHTSSLSLY